MSWISWFYLIVGLVTLFAGIVTARRSPRNERIFATVALLLPIGFLLWAYADMQRAFDIFRIGSICCLVGLAAWILLMIRRNRAPR